MEGEKKQIVHGQCPRKLNLNAPLISTKRHSSVSTENMFAATPMDATHRVPFSWERIAGQPKDIERNDPFLDIDLPPPPGWYQPKDTKEEAAQFVEYSDYDDGCDGDDESNYDRDEEKRNERFSDAIDIFSLAESVDFAEINRKSTKDRSSDVVEPNFIIQRFLPDAQALAAASIANRKLPFSTSFNSSDASFSRAVSIRRSYPSPKGCGLGSLFPWRMKPKICSVKTPVCDTIIGANQKRTTD